MKTKLTVIIALLSLVFTSCEYDNFDEPNATLSGRIVYQGTPLGIRTNGAQLELWQGGYELYTKIPVYIAHDGSFSASLFNGQYKLVRLSGAPWLPQSQDTIIIDVKGHTVKDIEVVPYLSIRNESFQKVSTGTVTAKFTIDKVVDDSELAEVRLFFGKNLLTDQNKHEFAIDKPIETITPGQETSITATLPEDLVKLGYLFIRVGVRSNKSNEFIYTQVKKIDL